MIGKIMDIKASQARWIILISYLFCLAFDSMVLLDNASLLVPPLTIIVLLYWCANFLDRTHLFSAFVLGLMADTLYQTTLGAHALLFCFIAFLMVRHRLRFRAYPVWQQAFFIGAYMMLYQILNYIFFSPVLINGDIGYYYLMPFVSLLLWPALTYTLRRITLVFTHG